MSVELRRLRARDAALLREVRLRALREAPEAFATRLEEARTWPPERWAEMASETDSQVTVVALYAQAGFAETGRRRPLPADPARIEVFLSRPADPATPTTGRLPS